MTADAYLSAVMAAFGIRQAFVPSVRTLAALGWVALVLELAAVAPAYLR